MMQLWLMKMPTLNFATAFAGLENAVEHENDKYQVKETEPTEDGLMTAIGQILIAL